MARTLRLSRLGLILWLLTPVVIAALLWTQMDPSLGKPDARLMPHTPPGANAPETPDPTAAVNATDTPGSPPAPATPSTSRPAPPEARDATLLVEPESLLQGYILVVTDATAEGPDRGNGVSGLAGPSSPIYVASNYNGWNPADSNQKLSQRPDGRWQIVMGKPPNDSRIAFKFTRGGWDTVEVDAAFQDIPNRSLPLVDPASLTDGARPVFEFTVPRWADQRPRGADSGAIDPNSRAVKLAGGRVQRVQVVGGGGAGGAAGAGGGGGVRMTRDLIVWLPPGYDDDANAARRYPVLYMQDGQNLFDRPPGPPGAAGPTDEWRADETAVELIAQRRIEPLIIVGIPHAGVGRVNEYLPTPALGDATPRGDAYVEFVVNEVIPRVERTCRVKSGPEHTAIGGSSLGGLISLYAAMKRPDIFGKVLAESPSLRIRGEEIWKPAFDGFTKGPRVIYLGMGGRELGDRPEAAEENRLVVESLESLKEWLTQRHIGERIQSRVDPEAHHNEAAWAARLPKALEVLFPPAP